MKVIGLTGGIASGKSTVAEMLRRAGAEVLDADQVAREAVEPGMPALARIVEEFGPEVLTPDGRLDRPKLASIVFSDASRRERLNAIVHPAVRHRMRQAVEEWKSREPASRFGVLVIPLLFESGLQEMVDEVWLVAIDPENQVERLIARDRLTPEEAQKRLAAQWPLERKKALADRIIDNTAPPKEVETQVLSLLRAENLL